MLTGKMQLAAASGKWVPLLTVPTQLANAATTYGRMGPASQPPPPLLKKKEWVDALTARTQNANAVGQQSRCPLPLHGLD
jgi:hypothetical protein